MQEKPSSYFFNQTNRSYQLVFNLFGADRAQLHAYLSIDKKRLHVVSKREFDKTIQRNLWIFALPQDTEVESITIDCKNNVYLIEIPKRSIWGKRKTLLPLRATSMSEPQLEPAIAF